MNSQEDLESDLENWLKSSRGTGLKDALTDSAAELPGECDLEIAPPGWCLKIVQLERERSHWRRIAGLAVAACLTMGFFSIVSLQGNSNGDSGLKPDIVRTDPDRDSGKSNIPSAGSLTPETQSFQVGSVASRLEQSRKRLTALSFRSKFTLRQSES